MEGSGSQFFYLGPSLGFRKCRNLSLKRIVKSYPYFEK